MKLHMVSLVGLSLVALLLLGAMIWQLQGRLVFYPLRDLVLTPDAIGLDYQAVAIATADGEQLSGWWVSPTLGAYDRALTLLFLHGNAGNVSHRAESLAVFARLGLAVLIIDYRGYGESTGRPSETGVYRDAEAAWRWLTIEQGVKANEIVLFGRSLGGAVAVELAARLGSEQAPAGLIVESSFDRLASPARALYPLLTRLIPLRFRFAAVERIPLVDCPVMILHSPDDELIPVRFARRLFDAAPEPKTFVELQGGHNDAFLSSQPAYEQTLAAFLAELPGGTDAPHD